ncbi:hypothetical protein L9F63_001368, partial [Diploptera punctata]
KYSHLNNFLFHLFFEAQLASVCLAHVKWAFHLLMIFPFLSVFFYIFIQTYEQIM